MNNCLRFSFLFLSLLLCSCLLQAQLPDIPEKKNSTDSIMLSAFDTASNIKFTDSLTVSKKEDKKTSAFAPDTLFLKNGDKITGTILSFEQGRIKIDAEGPGVVTVKWYKITTLAGGNRLYKIEDVNGNIYFGKIESSKDTGEIMISNIIKFDIKLENIARIYPIEEKWYRGIKGSFGGGLTYAKSTDVFTVNTEYNLYYELSKWTFVNNFSFVANSTEDKQTSVRIQSNLQALYSLPKKWVLSEINSFNKNDQLGISSRYTIGAKAGNKIVQTEWQRLLVLTGINGNLEKDNDRKTFDPNVEWPISLQHTIYKFFRPNISTSTSIIYYTGLTQPGRNRWDLSTDVTWEFIKNCKLQFAFYFDYDNKKIEGKTNNNDYGTTLSFLIDLK